MKYSELINEGVRPPTDAEYNRAKKLLAGKTTAKLASIGVDDSEEVMYVGDLDGYEWEVFDDEMHYVGHEFDESVTEVSKSKAQAKTMTAACKSPKFRKKVKIPKDVACDFHKADKGKFHEDKEITLEDSQDFHEEFGYLGYVSEAGIFEAEYQGRKVELNKPMQGDVKKFKVYVKDPSTGNVKKVNFGQKGMSIKKDNPERRKSFRARHNCDNPGPKTKARYWSCRKW